MKLILATKIGCWITEQSIWETVLRPRNLYFLHTSNKSESHFCETSKEVPIPENDWNVYVWSKILFWVYNKVNKVQFLGKILGEWMNFPNCEENSVFLSEPFAGFTAPISGSRETLGCEGDSNPGPLDYPASFGPLSHRGHAEDKLIIYLQPKYHCISTWYENTI